VPNAVTTCGAFTNAANTWSAVQTFSVQALAKNLNNIRFADQFATGSSTGGIQEAVNDLPSTGGIVYLPYGATNVISTINIAKDNVLLIGHGSYGIMADLQTVDRPASELKWTGSAGGTLLQFTAAGTTGAPPLVGGGIWNAKLNGNASAAVVLWTKSVNKASFKNLYLTGATASAMRLDTVAITPAGYAGTTRCTFENIDIRDVDSGQTSAHGIYMTSADPANSNVNFNIFTRVLIQHSNGNGIYIADGDNNILTSVLIRVQGAGTGKGVLIDEQPGHIARANYFMHVDFGLGGAEQKGTSTRNYYVVDQDNGSPLPTLTSGIAYIYESTGGIRIETVRASQFISKAAANPAQNSVLRVGSIENAVSFRNNANTGDIVGLTKDAADVVQVGGAPGAKTIGPLVVNGDSAMSAAPRVVYATFLPGALTSTWTGSTLTPDKAISATRMHVQVKTAPGGCTTNAVVRLSDGTTVQDVTITATNNDSGAITKNYAAGAPLTVSVLTAAVGCTTSPADANVIVQYRMQ
jgi:hypothetical protein